MFDTLYSKASKYISDNYKLEMIKKSYAIADNLHENQMRESGDMYITHPLSVSSILVDMHQDAASICAGLLHDVIEDTDIDHHDLKEILIGTDSLNSERIDFVDDIVKLVEQVTKVKHENYESKLIKGTIIDMRVMMIKLADRLHNMRTLHFKSDPKRRASIALKTFNNFIPWAKYLGAYNIKYELEDLCFKEISPDIYEKLSLFREEVKKMSEFSLKYAVIEIDNLFPDKNIFYVPNIKNVYGIYKSGYPRLESGQREIISALMLQNYNVLQNVIKNYKNINELVQLKIITNSKEDCFDIASALLDKYQDDSLINQSKRDYITNSKKNMYRSYDFIINGLMYPIQYQIRTEEMDLYNRYGLMYKSYDKKNLSSPFKEELRESIIQCNSEESIVETFQNLSVKKIRVIDYSSKEYYLDYGNTIVDLAYKINSNLPDIMNGALINGNPVRKNYVLKDGDIFFISTKLVESSILDRAYALKKEISK